MPNDRKQVKHRVRVERGIYRYYNGNYAVCYMAGGRPKFKTVGPKIGAARAERERLNVAVREGRPTSVSRLTFNEVADDWLDDFEARVLAGEKAPRTLERYRHNIDRHVRPRLGARPIQQIRRSDIVRLISQLRAAGLAAWTICGVLVAASRVFAFGNIEDDTLRNPVRDLDKDDRPKVAKRQKRILTHDEIGRLLTAATDTYAPLLTTAVFTGMRLSELLGLRWDDVDFDGGFVNVRYQLSRARVDKPAHRVRLKTDAGQRDIPLLPQLAAFLRRHKLAAGYSQSHHYVFTTECGTPMSQRNVQSRGVTSAADRASLNPTGEQALRLHDLRHTFASHLIVDLKLDVVYVSRILGHADPSITLRVYADLIDKARHADDLRKRMADSDFGGILDTHLTRAVK